MDFREDKKYFSREIKRVQEIILDIHDKKQSIFVKTREALENYKRELHIACRHIELLLTHKSSQEKIDAAKRMCYFTRFTKKEAINKILEEIGL